MQFARSNLLCVTQHFEFQRTAVLNVQPSSLAQIT
jgi:hypothetical protein